MAPRKSKKLEKLGITEVRLYVRPDATENHDYVTMTFVFGEYSSSDVSLKWMRTRADYEIGGYSRDIDFRASQILALREKLGKNRNVLDVGRTAYTIPFACRVDDAKVDGNTSIDRLMSVLSWVKGIESQGSFTDVCEAVDAESVGLTVRYRFDNAADKWVNWIDWDDAGWGKTSAWVYGAESEALLGEYHAARAKRLAEREQKEVA
jgi:hypothetical protein